jgi:hypothetical protein
MILAAGSCYVAVGNEGGYFRSTLMNSSSRKMNRAAAIGYTVRPACNARCSDARRDARVKIQTVLARSHWFIRVRSMLAWYGRKQGNGGTRAWLLPPRTAWSRQSGNSAAPFFCRASLNPHGQEIDLSRHRPDPMTRIKRFLATTLLGGWGIGWLNRKVAGIDLGHAPAR